MRPLRWLLMAGHVPAGGSLGGVVRYTVELARALGRREDVELHLTCRAGAAADLRSLVSADAHLHRLPVPDRASLAEPYLLPALLGRAGRWDVAQGAKHLLPRVLADVRALTVHDMLLLDRPADFGPAKRRLLTGRYVSDIGVADLLLCVSAATRDRLRAWSPSAHTRDAVTPLACPPSLLEALPEAVPELVGRPFALVVGDPNPRKNVPTAVDAFAAVADRVPGAVLALVGPPSWGESRWGEQLAHLEERGRLVRLTGVGDGSLRWCYEQARVVMCPSLAEGFGLPVVEALDLGAQVLTSDDAALVEAAGGRAAAVLPALEVPAWAAALEPLLRSERRPSAAGPRRTWDDVAADTVSAARRSLSASGRRG